MQLCKDHFFSYIRLSWSRVLLVECGSHSKGLELLLVKDEGFYLSSKPCYFFLVGVHALSSSCTRNLLQASCSNQHGFGPLNPIRFLTPRVLHFALLNHVLDLEERARASSSIRQRHLLSACMIHKFCGFPLIRC